jgi:phage-related protein
MPAALPLTTRISQGSTRKRINRVLTASFGDGYSQEAPDGINSIVDEWSVSFENLSSSERAVLWAVLDAVGSWDYLTWTPPGDTAKKWKVTKDGVSEMPVSGEMYTVSFSLRQVF